MRLLFITDYLTVPFKGIQHVERLKNADKSPNGLWLITCHTHYDMEADCWSNPVFIQEKDAGRFMEQWIAYLETQA